VHLQGFFAHLEWDANTGWHELRLLLDHLDLLIPLQIHIGAWPLEEAMRRVAAEAAGQGGGAAPPMNEITPEISPLLWLLLYLGSEAADYGGSPRPANPRPVKTAKGPRLFPPQGPRVWEVGARLGAALRRAYTEASMEGVFRKIINREIVRSGQNGMRRVPGFRFRVPSFCVETHFAVDNL